MRTRSSRSYALLEPRDAYEIAGLGLLDCIEESFYLDDDEHEDGDDGAGGGDESSGLSSLVDSEEEEEQEEIMVLQSPLPTRRLIVKLRIPGNSATGQGCLVKDEIKGDVIARAGVSDEKKSTLLEKERPRLMVVLRMPRSVGRAKDFLAKAQPDQKDTRDAMAKIEIEVVPEEKPLHEEEAVMKEIKDWVGVCSEGDDLKVRTDITLPESVPPAQISVMETDSKDLLAEEKDELVECQDAAILHEEAKEHAEPDTMIESKMTDHIRSGSIAILAPEPESHTVEDISPVEEVDGQELLETAEMNGHSGDRRDLLPDQEAEDQIEIQQPAEEFLNPSEHADSSPTESSTSSSHSDDDDLWPRTKKSSEDLTTSLVPTPLTMPSPELPSEQIATPPREPSPRIASRKRRRSVDTSKSEAEIHGHKRQKQRKEATETEISIPGLREATRGTGVMEAGIVAQRRRGVGLGDGHFSEERVNMAQQSRRPQQSQQPQRPRQPSQPQQQQARRPVQKPKRKPPEKSGRQRLLEQRISSSSQRARSGGGGQARAKRKRSHP